MNIIITAVFAQSFLTFVLQPVLHEYAARPSLADGFSPRPLSYFQY